MNATRLGVPLSLLALALVFAACGDSDNDDGATSTPTTDATVNATQAADVTVLNTDGWLRGEGLRGDRYCEVLLATAVEGRLNAAVWNTYGLNDCPDAEFRALDAAAIKAEREVLFALINGPRYWLMDAIERKPSGPREETTFGGLEMFLAANVDIGPIPPNLAPFTERRVARETVFEYSDGAQVFELTDPTGRVFVMQSYSQQNDPSLTEETLAEIGTRISAPDGWTFASRTLDETMRVLSANNEAVVVQDGLGNTYQLIESE